MFVEHKLVVAALKTKQTKKYTKKLLIETMSIKFNNLCC